MKDRGLDARSGIITEAALPNLIEAVADRALSRRWHIPAGAKLQVILYSEIMPGKLLDRLKESPVLCDGAMGTLLYGQGIFINRCYDELNTLQPDLIRSLHHQYLQSGAEIIETNTFGGNRFRLDRHSLGDKVKDINLTGARLAREAAKSFDAWVAGSVGPLGIRIEPLG